MADFEEIDTLRDDDSGLVAVITRKQLRSGDSIMSFRLFKEFRRRDGGPLERTNFFNRRHLDAIPKMMERVRERIGN